MPGQKHGKICLKIGASLLQHTEANDLGHVTSNDSFIQTGFNPDTIRGPDVCYFSYERLPRGPIPEGILAVNPELVIEVRSPSNTWSELFLKVGEYLRAGVLAVVILDSETSTASVFRPNVLQQIIQATEMLTVPEILPGWAMQVGKLFE